MMWGRPTRSSMARATTRSFGGKGNDRLASEDGVAGNDSLSGRPGFDVFFIADDTTSVREQVVVVASGS